MEIDYNELFAIEEPEGTADPAGTETAEEPAAQAEEKTAEQTEEKPAEEQEKPAEQTREERSRQAMARRIREAEERAAKAATKAAEERFSAMLARNGIEDSDTNEVLDSLEKFAAYDQKKSNERVKNGNATEGDIRRIIREEREQAEKPQGITQEQREEMDRELRQIGRMDPQMTDLKAILESDVGQAFRGFVGAGDDFVTAFYKAKTQLSQIPAKAAEAAKAKAAGKEHLSKTRSLGTEELQVPKDVMAQYRVFFPDATEAEIRKYYNADQKKYGPK